MAGTLKVGGVTLATHSDSDSKVNLTNVDAVSANTMSTSSFTSDIPLFRVGLNNNYSLAADSTLSFPGDKVIYDTHSRYNATSTESNGIPAYSYMPTVSGYYNFTASMLTGFQNETVGFMVHIQKYTIPDTSTYESVSHNVYAPTGSTSYGSTGGLASGIIYMNGTTDYVLCKIYQYNYSDTDSAENIKKDFSFFQGFLIRK